METKVEKLTKYLNNMKNKLKNSFLSIKKQTNTGNEIQINVIK